MLRPASSALALILALGACSAGDQAPPATGSGGQTGAGGSGGTTEPGTGGSSPGSGGSTPVAGTPDAATTPDSAAPSSPIDGAAPSSDGAAAPTPAGNGMFAPTPPGMVYDFGKVGDEPLVPMFRSADPVPPLIAPECQEDPTAGFAEYDDTFVIQRPYDLPASDRFELKDGIYTEWVLPNDKSHATWSGTHSRTETRYSDFKTGEYLFSGDVMVENGSENVCIFQVKGALGPIGIYLRVNGGNMHQLSGGNVIGGIYDKWYNLKVAWDTSSGTGRVWINNCLKLTVHGTKGSTWYFKHGTYTCDSKLCRDHYKNIHLYRKGATDPLKVKSPIR
jgi:hypothetical protein